MKINVSNIIKFLFPEWQIIDNINEYGFVARKNKYNNAVKQQEYTSRKYHEENLTYQNNHISTCTAKISNLDNKVEDSNTAKYEYKDTSKVNIKNVSKVFEDIRNEIGNLITGQKSYLNNLCIAFKRPFVAGYDKFKPKNNIIIFGNRGTGKHSGISCIAELLKKKKVISSHKISSIDLSLYSTVSEFEIFLSDLYKALYAESDIVVFDNFDKCHSSVIDAIEILATTGKYTLGSRYVVQNNNLVKADGTLLQNSISEISSNSKYFIFPSEKSEKELENAFGRKFISSIGDILYTEDFNSNELNKIALRIIDDFRNKCKENLSMNIRYDKAIYEKIVSSYRASSGVIGLESYVDKNIYKPLAEYKLKNDVSNSETVFLLVFKAEFVIKIGKKVVRLDSIVPQKKVYGIDEVKKELEEIIGIDSVKQYILRLEDNLKVQKIREDAGFKASNVSMHMIFTGNPGTGKTTIARIVAKYLKALGILSEGQLKEVTRADLVGQYVGQTAKLTNDVIKSALGGVLFIDEAYAVCRDKNDVFGIEAIDTLVKGIEDYRDDLVVILAGYKEEMSDFLKTNSGLVSRFPNIINFEDYTPEEMYRISLIIAKSKGYRIADNCKDNLIRLYEKKQVKGRNDSGNGRLARNIIESSILNQSKRLLEDSKIAMDLLETYDFNFEEVGVFDLENELAKVIGLNEVKDYIRSLSARLRMQSERKKMGLPVDHTQTMHMIFKGNPGTGKTMIARTVAEVLYNIGIVKTNNLVETDRSGLVAGYVGQTAMKTREKFMEAIDGVLFIDEAYSLSKGGANDFGGEAIDTLVKLIDDYRDRIVVILAGYSDDMDDFLSSNAGLKSRFPNITSFQDYSVDELIQICEMLFKRNGYEISKEAQKKLQIIFSVVRLEQQFGNGRYVRNLYEKAVNNQAMRLSSDTDLTREELITIIESDIERV